MIDPRPALHVIGLGIAALGVLMAVPMALDLARGDANWAPFLEAGAITALAGTTLALATANGMRGALTLPQAFLLTTGLWAILPAFGALPFILGVPDASVTDAYFEAMSGLTTTGTTVFVGLDSMPRGTLLWRAMLQWLGGLGIVIVALVFLPVMRVGGMQFFRSEGFDTLGKILPRAADISAALLRVYVLLTAACATVYIVLGMSVFDAVAHAFTTISTGGFSSSDQSFGLFAGPAEYAGVLFMVLASVPFIRLVQLSGGSFAPLLRDVQVRAYLRWLGYASALILAYLLATGRDAPGETVREVLFNVVSTFSGTGYSSTDLYAWGAFPLVILVISGAIGGCTASTGCSIKIFRYLVLIEAIKAQIRQLYSPSRVVALRLEGRDVSPDVLDSVILLFTTFILGFGALIVGLALTGLSVETSITAAWTAIFNIGPAFGPEIGPTGAVDAFPAGAKWMMSAGMLAGRLEMISVLVLFTRRLWQG